VERVVKILRLSRPHAAGARCRQDWDANQIDRAGARMMDDAKRGLHQFVNSAVAPADAATPR
jgi:hypothetical protein